jgi:uncharacterized protein (TIGR02266 family)
VTDPKDRDPTSSDRREKRVDADLAVTVNSDHNFLAGFATNISAGGIFIATSIVHPVGTKFNLSIHLDDGDARVVRGVGEVRWLRARQDSGNTPQGIGIRFISIQDDGEDRIKRFLAVRAPLDVSEMEDDMGLG